MHLNQQHSSAGLRKALDIAGAEVKYIVTPQIYGQDVGTKNLKNVVPLFEVQRLVCL